MTGKSDSEPIDSLDLRVLAQLATIQRNGRRGFVEQVIAVFLQTAPNLIRDLQAASARNECANLHRASHTLKPCSATVGALSLAALCEALERMARSGSVENAPAKVGKIAEEYERVEAALKGSLCVAD